MLLHHDDGKQKYQSHAVYISEPYIAGYGRSKEEAYEEFQIKYKEYIFNLTNLPKGIDDTIKVDWQGNRID